MVARAVSDSPPASTVLPAAVSPSAAIASMTKWRGPLSITLSAPKRFLIAASVILSQAAAGQSFSPSVL